VNVPNTCSFLDTSQARRYPLSSAFHFLLSCGCTHLLACIVPEVQPRLRPMFHLFPFSTLCLQPGRWALREQPSGGASKVTARPHLSLWAVGTKTRLGGYPSVFPLDRTVPIIFIPMKQHFLSCSRRSQSTCNLASTPRYPAGTSRQLGPLSQILSRCQETLYFSLIQTHTK
jgi:hypothetical protein